MDFVIVEKGHSTFKIVDDDLNVAFAGGRQTILRAGPKLLSRIERFDITRDDMGQAPEEEVWSCPAYVPVSQLIYAAFRSNAKGLFPPNDECRRLGL